MLSIIPLLGPIMGNCKSKKEEDNIDENDHREQTLTTEIVPEAKVFKPLSNQNPQVYEYQRTPSANGFAIDSTKAEVNNLLEQIHTFKGTNENDKDYRYLDEMLTRCILKLDNIECSNQEDRCNRKQAIREINQALSILERKLELNSDIKKLVLNLSET